MELELVIKATLFRQEKGTGKCSTDTTFDWEAGDVELLFSEKAFLVVFTNTVHKQSLGALLPRSS